MKTKIKKNSRHARKVATPLQRLTNKYAKLTPEEREAALDLHTKAIVRAQAQWQVKDREPWSKPQVRPVGPIQPLPHPRSLLDSDAGIDRSDLSDDPAEVGTLSDINLMGKRELEFGELYGKPKEGAGVKLLEDMAAAVEALDDMKAGHSFTNLPPAPLIGEDDGKYLTESFVPAVVGQLLSTRLPSKTELPKEAGTFVVELGEDGVLNEVHRVTPKSLADVLGMNNQAIRVSHDDDSVPYNERACRSQAYPRGSVQPLPQPGEKEYMRAAEDHSDVAIQGLADAMGSLADSTNEFLEEAGKAPVEPVLIVRESWWERILNWFRA